MNIYQRKARKEARQSGDNSITINIGKVVERENKENGQITENYLFQKQDKLKKQ